MIDIQTTQEKIIVNISREFYNYNTSILNNWCYIQVEEKFRQIETCCEGYIEQGGLCVRNCTTEAVGNNTAGSCNPGIVNSYLVVEYIDLILPIRPVINF